MSTSSIIPLLCLSVAVFLEFGIHEIVPHVCLCLCIASMRTDSSPEVRASHGLVMLLIGMFWTYVYGASWSGLFSVWAFCAGVSHLLISLEESIDK
jgi:hypothetical protein